MDQAPCGPAVPCLSRQARAAVMVRLRGEADAGHRSAVSGHRSPVKQVIGRQCHSGVSVIRVNTGMVNFRKFLLPNKAVIFLKIFREIYICPKRGEGREEGGGRPSGVPLKTASLSARGDSGAGRTWARSRRGRPRAGMEGERRRGRGPGGAFGSESGGRGFDTRLRGVRSRFFHPICPLLQCLVDPQ